MYIDSRTKTEDRLNAYKYSLTRFCLIENASDKERRYLSACILDIFLQMIDFLCTSGNVEKAIQKISGLAGNSDDTLLLDIDSFLTVHDRCIFWFSCIYLVIYGKLPEVLIEQFEYGKELPFAVEWPSANLTDRQDALDLMKLAIDKMALDIDGNPYRNDQAALRSLHFLAVSHVKCVAALEGLDSSAELLSRYLSLYPTCIELVLISSRLKEYHIGDVTFKGFEESISNWPKETSGIQCLWNQYVEQALSDGRINLAEILLARWFLIFSKDAHDGNFEGRKYDQCDDGLPTSKQDDTFLFLNLSLYRTLQKNLRETGSAIDTALKLASPQDYGHCAREHAAFSFADGTSCKRKKPMDTILDLLNSYLADSRSMTQLEPLSRKYYLTIKRPRVRQNINSILGPVSRDFTFVNSVLEACYGPSLLPEKLDDPKGYVDFIESLMEITPANYELALSVYKSTIDFCDPSVPGNTVRHWAYSLLINSIFQSIPVAPEHIWLEAANAMRNSEGVDISVRFHQQAISVYPFSIQLWHSYLSICRNTEEVDVIVESARERGVELGRRCRRRRC